MSIVLGDTANGVNGILQNLAANNFNINPIFDGDFHRFNRLKKNSGWYVAHMIKTDSGKNYPVVICGDWVSGEKFKFHQDATSEKESKDFRAAIEKAMQQEGIRRKEKQDFAIALAAEEWNLAENGRLAPYMQKKGFESNFGCRVMRDGTLLIPMFAEGTMYGLERIYPNGKKLFLSGQRFKGCHFTIGNVSAQNPAYICEGFATACSINIATGQPVIVAFSANNMVDVAKEFIGYHLIPAADNDRFTEGNPGVTAAGKCSALLGHRPVVPTFPPDDKESTDFNDLHMKYGADEVRKQLEVGVNNVVGIKSKAPAKAKKKMSDVYLAISNAMRGVTIDSVPAFPIQFHIIEPSPGTRLIAQETEPQVLHYVSEKAVTQAILQYAHNLYLPRTGDGVGFEQRHANDCMKFWRDIVEPIAEPHMVSWPDDDGYTLRRLPWPMEIGPTPLFDELMERTSNSDALRSFIGSLFFQQSDLQQYVWIFGMGQNGKGALSRFLRKALNGAYTAQMVPSPNDKFWTSGLIGARLVVFPDCNNKSFVASGLFKSLTGGDPVKIEQKGQQPYTTELKAKYMFLSNERPHLSSEKADTRRAIYCEMDMIQCDPRPDYEDELWAEGGRFLAKCFSTYQRSCPDHGQIFTTGSDENLKDWISTLEEDFEVAVQKHFVVDLRKSCSPGDFQKKLDNVWKNDRKTHMEFRSWLERQYGIRKKSVRNVDGSGVTKIYSGIDVVPFSTSNIAE